jgi:hypothetical protein
MSLKEISTDQFRLTSEFCPTFRSVKMTQVAQRVIGVGALASVAGLSVVDNDFQRTYLNPIWDRFLPSPKADLGPASTAKAWGTVGAAVGANLGSFVATPLALVGLAQAAPLALTIGAAAAAYLLKPLRVVGAMVGGALGMAAGWAAERLGHQVAPELAKTTQGFSLGQLPSRIWRVTNSSPRLSERPEARQALEQAQPGDILLAHRSGLQPLADLTVLSGRPGEFTHVGYVAENGNIIDIHNGPAEEGPRDNWLKFQHLAVVRPDYQSPQSIAKVDRSLRELAQKASYNLSGGIILDQSSTTQYCGKFVAHGLEQGAPEVKLASRPWLSMNLVVAGDFLNQTKVFDSGANYWHNKLRYFC